MNTGMKGATNHNGGRSIWQLKDAADLLVAWDPVRTEVRVPMQGRSNVNWSGVLLSGMRGERRSRIIGTRGKPLTATIGRYRARMSDA